MERSCNECRALRLIEGHEVNSGTQFNVFAQEFGHLCNVQSIFDHHEPRSDLALFRVMNRYVGNLAPMPGEFQDYPAPWSATPRPARELSMMRRGMPPPPEIAAAAGHQHPQHVVTTLARLAEQNALSRSTGSPSTRRSRTLRRRKWMWSGGQTTTSALCSRSRAYGRPTTGIAAPSRSRYRGRTRSMDF